MEVHKQIKSHRLSAGLSQEDLAEKIYVTRQSVSNWETGKTYPDLHSLLALSQLFDITLDALVKGDIDIMKDKIENAEAKRFTNVSIIFAILSIVMLTTIAPLYIYLGIPGLFAWGVIVVMTMAYSLYVERLKKTYNIQTYKEIRDFMDGKQLDEIREECSSFSNTASIITKMLIGAIVGFALTYIMMMILS